MFFSKLFLSLVNLNVLIYALSLILLITGCKKVNNDCNLKDYPNAPNKEWTSEIAGSQSEAHGHYILTCSDGGFIQIGETGTLPNSAKIMVVKTDETGKLLWKKEFSDGGHNLGNSVIETKNAYIICGAINENSAIIKLNKNSGAVIFNQTIDNGGNDAFENIICTSGGIIAVGYVNANDPNNTFFTEGEGYLTVLDSNGSKIKGLNLNNHIAHAYRIRKIENNLFISGLTKNASDYGLLKTNLEGNIIWSKRYGGASEDHCFGMDVSDDGSIFLTGHTKSGTQNWDTYTTKIDTSGNQLWEIKYGNPRGFDPKFIHDEAWDIKSTNDGGCIVIAGTGDEYNRYKRRCGNSGDNSNTWHIYLIKLDQNGNLDWQKTYGGGKGTDWAGEAIDLTPDGGAIIALDNGKFGFVKISPFQ